MEEKNIPIVNTELRSHIIEVPEIIQQASGIRILGKVIRSIIFTTDVAIVRNNNAQAVMAVYPFTPQAAITHSIIAAAEMPVFCGVGGGLTKGERVGHLARDAEAQGAFGVVLNAPTENSTVELVNKVVDIPIVATMVNDASHIVKGRQDAGVDIINVSGAAETPDIVRTLRRNYPDLPIIATGGPTIESIERTLDAGANAITYTPPTSAELFKISMEKYRMLAKKNQL